jgi:hypothetical protein
VLKAVEGKSTLMLLVVSFGSQRFTFVEGSNELSSGTSIQSGQIFDD